MIPSNWIQLDALPLTPNGKTDRRALPAPDLSRIGAAEVVGPRNPTEALLASFWADILQVERVSIHDSFFAQGGHSLTATRLVSRIRTVFGLDIPLRWIFESPTVAAMGVRIDEAGRNRGVGGDGPIPLVPRDGDLPLSFAQERLWFLNRLDGPNATYNMAATLNIRGNLDREALSKALNALVARHESLRTTFPGEADRLVQRISSFVETPLDQVDLGSLPQAERQAEARRLALAESRRCFDPAVGPLVRFSLLRLSRSEHLLLFNMHHMIADGWTIGILLEELHHLYDAFSRGQEHKLGELPIQYADFAHWQRGRLRGEVLEHLLNYWKQQLSGAPELLTLPGDRPRPKVQTANGAVHAFDLDADLHRALERVALRGRSTLFMTLLSAFKVLLYRYSGQADVVVGAPVANRNRAETEGVVGLFVNTLAVRDDLSGNPAFLDLLERVRETTLAAYAHQELPLEKLVEELAPERSLSYSPLFQVMFDLRNEAHRFNLGDLDLTLVEPEWVHAKFDLSLEMETRADGMKAWFEYNTDLFDPATITRMTGHFKTLLSALAEAPETTIDAVPLMDEAETHRLIHTFNPGESNPTTAPSFIDRFEAAAAAAPRHPALLQPFESGALTSLTYGELNQRANRLAHELSAHGVGPETVVAAAVPRSIDMVVAILGILKTGAAFLPLDPDYPAERLAYMLADSDPVVLVAAADTAQKFSKYGIEVIRVDQNSAMADTNPARTLFPANTAYRIYTSGSTGKPKGISVTHAGLSHFCRYFIGEFKMDAADRVLQTASPSFDTAVEELALSLGAGACLVLRTEETLASAAGFLKRVAAWQLTVLDLPTAFWHQLAQQMEPGSLPPHVRLVIIGGERAKPEMADLWAKSVGHIRTENTYGPAEATIVASRFTMPGQASGLEQPSDIPIGRPLPFNQIHVLDRRLQPVPVGVTGELFIAGEGLARGYHNQALATAERFVPNPFSPEPGARMYRTGDLACYCTDGELMFKGRADHQVKIRGFRIELREIELALTKDPAVKEAVVVLRDDAGLERLAAYVLTDRSNEAGLVDDLRAHLRQTLPEFMVPAAIIPMASWPLTPNCKIDRGALPKPFAHTVRADYVAPRTETEEKLAAVWAEVLKLHRVGIHDHFFESGGHSLLATQVIARVRDIFAREIPLRQLFTAPSVADFAAVVEAGERADGPVLRARPLPEQPPLSFAQNRLWFLSQMNAARTAYNMFAGLRLRGHINPDALEAAVNALTQRHAVLRTVFPARDGAPYQKILQKIHIPIEKLGVDFRADQDVRVRELLEREADRCFDLAAGPLLHLSLLELGEDDHALFINMHHIISDGWSIGIFVRELAAAYGAFRDGGSSPLSEPAVQYVDFAIWQREWLSGSLLGQQKDYWRTTLDGVPTLLDLPADRPRPSVQSYNGAVLPFSLEHELLDGLTRLAHGGGTTLFVTLQAAFAVLLSKYTGRTQLLIGTPVANRTHRETESLIGFFANTLALYNDLDGDPRLSSLLGRLHTASQDAFAHGDLPFDQVVEALQPERNTAYSPLFQVMLSLNNAPLQSITLPGLEVTPILTDKTAAKFDLSLAMEEVDECLSGAVEYNVDLFDPARIQRLIGHFKNLLRHMVRDPKARVSELQMLGDGEWAGLQAWNRTAVDFGGVNLVHEAFQRQVDLHPRRTALIFEDVALDYQMLNQRANQLAHLLIQVGVGPETRVGLAAIRSVEMVVGILAVLKAGAAYVPLDPGLPDDRVTFMVEDAGLGLILTTSDLPKRFYAGVETLMLDQTQRLASYPDTNPTTAVGPDNSLYMLYTSGSTGIPKAVVLTHRAVCNRLAWSIDYYKIGPDDRFLQKTPYSFDVSVDEFFAALTGGACLVLAKPEGHKDPVYLAELIQAQRVTLVHFVPSMLGVFLTECDGLNSTLRAVTCAGEALSPELRDRFYKTMDTPLFNLYGPTEATVSVSYHACRPEGQVTIGRPIANTTLHIVDAALRPVPIGVPGELCIGGVALARGYHSRPDLTAAQFVPDPFAGNSRLYKTGDLARYGENGEIEFLGRIDHQVKIHGFRIESGEIEAGLKQHPRVQDALVTAREGADGHAFLAAYLIPSGPAPDTDNLREFLAGKMPAYMVPTAFIFLDRFPLTSSGKVSRKDLPEPGGVTLDRTAYRAPANPDEELLAGIWSEVLGLKGLGAEADFFKLGGHSLLANQVIVRVRKAFAAAVPLETLFTHPTVEGFAAALSKHRSANPHADSLITPVDRNTAPPLSLAQQRLWFLSRLQPDTSAYNMPFAVRLLGKLDRDALQWSVDALVARHETLRTVFPEMEDGPRQVIAQAAAAPIKILEAGDLNPADREPAARQWMSEEAQTPFDIGKGPLFRLQLICLDTEDAILQVTMHHLIADGWSSGILIRETATLYNARLKGEPPPLPDLPVQYADFGVWQRAWLDETVSARQLTYWKARLEDCPPRLNLPLKGARPPVQTDNGAVIPFEINGELTNRLKDFGQRHGSTLFMTLTAAFSTLLARYSNQTDIVIGTPVANRSRKELEPLIGFFVNTLVLRTDLSDDPGFSTLLARTRADVLAAFQHQDVPFEQVVEAVQPKRNLSQTPLFQVMFVFQNTADEPLAMTDLDVASESVELVSAKFDLTLEAAVRDGRIQGRLEYNTDLFDRAMPAGMIDHFINLLDHLSRDPETSVLQVDMLSERDKHQLLQACNEAALPEDGRGLFPARVAEQPSAVALIHGPTQITYADLNSRANRLARYLAELGVGPESLVGICMERNPRHGDFHAGRSQIRRGLCALGSRLSGFSNCLHPGRCRGGGSVDPSLAARRPARN